VISVDDALDRIFTRIPTPLPETIPLARAHRRVLTRPMIAQHTQPPFDASAMDGYALRSEDASQIGRELTVIGTSSAGHGFSGTVGQGEAVRIFTGAPVPAGADVVLIQEDAERLDGKVECDFDTARRLFTLLTALHWKG